MKKTGTMKIKNFVCTQCGAKDFVEEGPDKLRCKYCESLFFMQDETKKSSSGGVTIKKGAKVTFGKNANVTIRGKLEIEDGAEVEFNGTITLVEKSSEEKIKKSEISVG
jgi:DNA-directed RNA polymerase subunit RPC12/RpoP